MIKVSGITSAEYEEARKNGKPGEMEVFSVLRGGFAYKGCFYYNKGVSIYKATPASSIPLLIKIH